MTRRRLLAVWLALLAPGYAQAALAQAGAPDGGQDAYQAGKFDQARALWETRAAAGDASAAFGLGLLYDLGQGVRQDGAAAYRWYLRAAAAGNAQAEFNVAVMNDSGRGTARDMEEAALWYGRAASHGLGRAEYDLAQLYEAGEGLPRNVDAALAWYDAASLAVPEAAARAGKLRARLASRREDAAASIGALMAPSAAGPAHAGAGQPGELVWSAPLQPVPVRYYVVLLSLDSTPPASVFSGFTEKTALFVEAAAGLHAYAWRVCAVGRDTPHYAAGAWTVLRR